MMALAPPCLKSKMLSNTWPLPLMITTGASHRSLAHHEARRDQFRYTRTELPKQNSVALLPRQTLPLPHQAVTMTTPTQAIAGPPWRYKNAAIVFWQECKGRPYRTAGLRRRHRAALQQASQAPPLMELLRLTRLLGRRQASCLLDRAWRKLKECFVANSVWNYWSKTQVLRVAPREQGSAPSGRSCQVPPGRWFNNWRISISLSPADNTGPTGSIKQPTNGALGGAHLPPDHGRPMRHRARPRSLCACRFQCLRSNISPAIPTLNTGPCLEPTRQMKLRRPPQEWHRTAALISVSRHLCSLGSGHAQCAD